jgi:hypothetical protein
MGRTADKDDLGNIGLVDLQVAEHLLNGLQNAMGKVTTKLLKLDTGERSVEVDTLKEGVDLDSGWSGWWMRVCAYVVCLQTV